ncbi:MAG: FAD-dependent oxidoreductase, partial [Candidatus Brocadiia bacterium]
MTESITEPARDIPVLAEHDVVVCGGGPAGCAAAIAAARNGADTLLVEKNGYLGGATVSQLVCVILSTNAVDFQGIWHEFTAAMDERNAVNLPVQQGDYTYRGGYDPEIVKHVWDAMLTEAGVRILHHALCAGTVVEEETIRGVIVETKAGRQAILADRVVDATGDGHVCHRAGVPWEQGVDGKPWAMACTKVFRMGNVDWNVVEDSAEARETAREKLQRAIERGEFDSPVVLNKRPIGYAVRTITHLPPYRNEHMSVASRVLKVDPLDPFDMTRAEREGREQARQSAAAVKKCIQGYEDAYLLDTSNHLGVRSSRRVHGMERVTDEGALEFHKYDDGIARSSWDIDVWPAESYDAPAVPRQDPEYQKRIEKVKEGEYFDIRYGCLVAEGVDNLLMAGRCISASHLAEASLRIQQTCMATGQAAGTAAALSLDAGITPREMDPQKVVTRLE